VFLPEQVHLLLQVLKTGTAQAVAVFLFDPRTLLIGQYNTKALAFGNVPRLAFKCISATRTFFLFVATHLYT